MRREVVVAFALVASLLVVGAQPAAASHGPVVVSSHTTDTDFNAATLTNMSVVGSGTSATVQLASIGVIDSMEDGDLSEYGGDTGSFSVTSSQAHDGSNAAEYSNSSAKIISSTSGLSEYPSQGTNVTYHLRAEVDGGVMGAMLFTQNEAGISNISGYRIGLRAGDDAIRLYHYDSGTLSSPLDTSAATINADEWYSVIVSPTTDNWINVTVEDSAGNVVGTLSAQNSSYTSGGIGYLGAGGGVTRSYYFDDVFNEGGLSSAESGEYINNHTAEQSEQGTVNITENTNATVTVTYRGDSNGDGSYDTLLNQTSGITSVANHTFSWSVFGGDDVQVNVTVENASGNGAPAFTMADETVMVNASDPVVDDSSATPTGGLSTSTPTLEIDINDTDFPLAQGDSVEVGFFVDGTSQGTDTLTANGTASLQVGPLSGGDHTWHVVANDTYGHSVTSQTFDISTPGNVTVRNESDPHEVIDTVTVEAIIAGTGETVDVQNTTDGNISMVGLPTEEEYIFVLEADGFHTRTVIVEDIFEQDDVFMLNTSLTSIENTFVLDDQTGQFGGDNVTLIIQRPINRSVYDSSAPEEFQWTDIAGDRTGAAEEFTVDLEKEKRFRIIVDNNEGDRRVLGEYQAETAGSVTLNIGELTFDVGADGATYGYDASFTSSNVKFNYTDPDDTTSSLMVKIFESGNASNEIYNQTHTDLGTLSVTQALSGDEENETWVVEFSGTRDGESIAGSVVVGASDLSPGVPLDDAWKTRIAFSLLLVLTGLTAGGINAETGTVVAALAGGVLWWSGWLPAEIGGGVVALALFVAAALTLSTRGGEEIQ